MLLLVLILLFLSTLSLRRATSARPETRRHDAISIHALLAESDLILSALTLMARYFYPRSPCGERRCLRCCAISCITISIHALLAESDGFGAKLVHSFLYFYPRSPCGERPMVLLLLRTLKTISIHALLAESDRKVPLLGIK